MFTFLKFIIFRTNLLVLQRPKNVLFSRAEKKNLTKKPLNLNKLALDQEFGKVNILMEKHANFKSFERRDCAKNPLFQPLFSSFQSCSDSGN